MTAKELKAKLGQIPDDKAINLVIRHDKEAWTSHVQSVLTPRQRHPRRPARTDQARHPTLVVPQGATMYALLDWLKSDLCKDEHGNVMVWSTHDDAWDYMMSEDDLCCFCTVVETPNIETIVNVVRPTHWHYMPSIAENDPRLPWNILKKETE